MADHGPRHGVEVDARLVEPAGEVCQAARISCGVSYSIARSESVAWPGSGTRENAGTQTKFGRKEKGLCSRIYG